MDSSPPTHSLEELLADVLPKDYNFKITHISTPPTSTEALYSAPSGKRPDKTFLETHFLALSAKPSTEPEVLVYAIEVLIYTTASSTTFFVSKADSSGFLYLLNLPSSTPTPLKGVTTAFLQYLLKQRCRQGVQTIISLFARAQDQYLFARSIENKKKHVLDDTDLVKWWCRILDPLLSTRLTSDSPSKDEETSAKAYLTIPGLTPHESTPFFPPGTESRKHWSIGDPLREISRHENPPPRCVIPHFPDDPKSRFLDELDDEVLGNSQSQSQPSSSQSQGNMSSTAGQWRSVKTLEAFWEMMAFRQECSAGRLVGFIWVVFTGTTSPQTLPSNLEHESLQTMEKVENSKSKPRGARRRQRLIIRKTGPVISRPLRIHTSTYKVKKQVSSASTFSRPFSEEDKMNVLDDKDYHRTHELLLCLDFSTLKKAAEATSRWGKELRTMNVWGVDVLGRSTEKRVVNGAAGAVNLLQPGKRKQSGEEVGGMNGAGEEKPKVNVLSGGMVRKKPKTA